MCRRRLPPVLGALTTRARKCQKRASDRRWVGGAQRGMRSRVGGRAVSHRLRDTGQEKVDRRIARGQRAGREHVRYGVDLDRAGADVVAG